MILEFTRTGGATVRTLPASMQYRAGYRLIQPVLTTNGRGEPVYGKRYMEWKFNYMTDDEWLFWRWDLPNGWNGCTFSYLKLLDDDKNMGVYSQGRLLVPTFESFFSIYRRNVIVRILDIA